MADGGVIIRRGRPHPVDFPVLTWVETGMRFYGRDRPSTQIVVNHWTGAENPPQAVYHNMLNHKNAFGAKEPLSVHFIVAADGTVYQTADCELRCAHAVAHGANGYSVGIEFVGRGTGLDLPDKGVHREVEEDRINGRTVRYANLTTAQTLIAIRLNRALCKLYELPFKVPTDLRGRVQAVEPDAITVSRFRGCVGHYWLESRKADPGLQLMRALQEASREPPLVA